MDLHDGLMAIPESMSYDWRVREGKVTLRGIGCTDMTGCIRFFRGIDRQVSRISTWNERGEDTVYVRSLDGQWVARAGAARAHLTTRKVGPC